MTLSWAILIVGTLATCVFGGYLWIRVFWSIALAGKEEEQRKTALAALEKAYSTQTAPPLAALAYQEQKKVKGGN